MKILTIQSYQKKINKNIQLVESSVEIKNLAAIIKACRMKPFPEGYSMKKLNVHRKWVDEFGNLFDFPKKSQIRKKFNYLLASRNSTDLYDGISLVNIHKISKFVHIASGKDEDLNEEFHFITFLGIDNYFRSYLYLYGEWQKISSLYLGIKILKDILSNQDIKLSKTEMVSFPILSAGRAEVTMAGLPLHQSVIIKSEVISGILKG